MRGVTRLCFQERTNGHAEKDSFNIGTNFRMRIGKSWGRPESRDTMKVINPSSGNAMLDRMKKESSHGKKHRAAGTLFTRGSS
jgi:hypothetical protein